MDQKNTHTKHAGVCIEKKAKILISFLLLVLALPFLQGVFYTDHKERSKRENRHLSSMPQISQLQQPAGFFASMEAYLEDHMGGTFAASLLYQKMLFYVFGDSPVYNVTIGKKGFVYLNAHDGQEKYANFERLCVKKGDPDIAAEYEDSIRKFAGNFTKRGYRVALGTAVSKPALYPEMLSGVVPDRVQQACEQYRGGNALFELREALKDEDFLFFYPFELFMENRNDPYFYPKENYHWYGRSSHLFARELISLLEIDIAEAYNEDGGLGKTKADLQSLIGFERYIDVWCYPYTFFQVSTQKQNIEKQLHKYFQNAVDYSYFKTEKPMSERKALIISNSFGAHVAPHLAPAYRELMHVSTNGLQEHEKKKFFGTFVENFDPDDIIFIFHDDAIYEYKNMALSL